METKEKNRIIYIDVIKAIGILFVMLNHSGIYFWPISNIIIAGFMQWFFILSGITNQKKNDKLSHKINIKFNRLIIPYFIYGILFTLIHCVLFNSFNLKYLAGLIYSRYMLYKDFSDDNIYFFSSFTGPLWFLTAMFISYILFFFYEKRTRIHSKIFLLFIYFIISLLLSFLPILLPWSIDTAFVGAILIIIGYELKKVFNSNYNNLLLNALLLIILITLTFYNGNVNMSIRIYGVHSYSILYFLLIGVISCYLFKSIIILFDKDSYLVKLIVYIGSNSLRLMCIHMFFIRLFNYSLSNIMMNIPMRLMIIMSIILTIFVCVFMDYIFKLPICKNSKISIVTKYM